LQQGEGHQGSKASKVAFLGRLNRLFTTGFSKHSERQYAVWDAVSTRLLKAGLVAVSCCPLQSRDLLSTATLLSTTAPVKDQHNILFIRFWQPEAILGIHSTCTQTVFTQRNEQGHIFRYICGYMKSANVSGNQMMHEV